MVDLDYDSKRMSSIKSNTPFTLTLYFQVCCGNWHYMALMESGQVYSWGYNDHGQLGLASKMESQVCNLPIQTLH